MSSATREQLQMLLQFMQEHSDFARGRLIRSVEGRVRAKALWADLASALNSTGGAIKTVTQWQKVWADRKYAAKKAAAACRRSASATGGGPAGPPLSEDQEAIIGLMGKGFGLPATNSWVQPFPLIAENEENIPPGNISSPEPAVVQDCAIATEDNQQTNGPEITETKVNQQTNNEQRNLSAQRERNQRRRPRFRRVQHQDLLESERQKNAELAGIRRELGEIKSTLRELVLVLRQMRE